MLPWPSLPLLPTLRLVTAVLVAADLRGMCRAKARVPGAATAALPSVLTLEQVKAELQLHSLGFANQQRKQPQQENVEPTAVKADLDGTSGDEEVNTGSDVVAAMDLEGLDEELDDLEVEPVQQAHQQQQQQQQPSDRMAYGSSSVAVPDTQQLLDEIPPLADRLAPAAPTGSPNAASAWARCQLGGSAAAELQLAADGGRGGRG